MKPFLFLIIMPFTLIFSQDDPFLLGANYPYGEYDYFDECIEMGFTEIQTAITDANYTYFQDLPMMLFQEQFLQDTTIKYFNYYTGGHYYKWELEQESGGSDYGFIYDDGDIIHDLSDGCWCWTNEGMFYGPKSNVVTGPASWQEKKYTKILVPDQNKRITYNLKLRYKIEFVYLPPQENFDILEINYKYRYYNELAQEYDEITVKNSDVISTEDAGSGYTELSTQYHLDINPVNNIPPFSSYATEGGDYSDLCDRCGFIIEFDYLGSRGYDLVNVYIDYVEIDCDLIGRVLVDPEEHDDIKENIQNSIEEYNLGTTNVLHYIGYNEPHYIDLYTPYKITDELMQEINSPKKRDIFSSYYISYDNINGVDRETRFDNYFSLAAPDTIKFNCYPIKDPSSWENISENLQQMLYYRSIVDIAASKGKDFIPAIQAHAWSGGQSLRRPAPSELESMVNIALAHTADGIHFYKLHETGRQCILNSDGSKSNLFYKIKNDIAPRLNNFDAYNQLIGPTNFAIKLRELEYTGNYLVSYYYPPTDAPGTQNSYYNNSISWVSDPNPESENHGYIMTELELKEPIPDWPHIFLYATNIFTSRPGYNSKDFHINYTHSSYNNYVIIEHGVGLISYYQKGGTDVTFDFPAGKGKLLKIAVALKEGGEIITNDTLHNSISLVDSLKINSNRSIVIKDSYTLQANIEIEDSAEISIGKFGNIILDGGNLYFTDWDGSLLLMEENNHPKLVWGVHPSLSPIQYYKIYRKIGDGNWGYITNTTGNSWVDSTYYVFQPGMPRSDTAYYKVTGYGGSGRPQESGFSNTVNIRIGTGEMQKRNNGLIVTEYALQQNYPNPFNPETTIKYQLPETSEVKLVIYDMLGRKVTTLVDETKEMGYYSVKFDGSALSSGMYMYKITAGKFSATKKMLLVK